MHPCNYSRTHHGVVGRGAMAGNAQKKRREKPTLRRLWRKPLYNFISHQTTIMKFRNVFLLMLVSVQLCAQSNPSPWFMTKKLNDNVWRISDGDIDNVYLITGRDSAMLIDTGLGFADLKRFVRTITTLPLIVVNTHSHPDHT